MQARELAKQIKSGKAPCVVDVRSGQEYGSGHIPGAVHVPFWSVLLRRKGLPKEKDALIVLACEHGPRALPPGAARRPHERLAPGRPARAEEGREIAGP
jgi:rhodanese-related sulfurtransferase